MITISVNELIKDLASNKVYRLLWIDESNIITYVIDIEDSNALPFLLKVKDIHQGFLENLYSKLESDHTDILINHLNLPEGMKQKRDTAWAIIKNLVNDEPSIYKKKERGQLINELVNNKVCTKMTAYKYLRKYWQRGKTMNSLLPDYSNSGGKGRDKKSGTLKRGKPRTTNSVGMNVTDETREIFRKSIKRYYFSSKRNSLSFAYKMMIKEFYADEVRYENGIKYIVIQDENKIPSLRQFRYWYNKEFGIKQTIVSREGEKKFERDHRAILGSSTYEVMGPGSRYQIDATTGNVYLKSSYNSDYIVGRPIIYFVVDVFTHMITGMYIGLEGPSWAGMMMAIANAASDKKEYCSRYGIEVSNEMWPSAHLPEIILGDRGELEGYNVNSLIEGLNLLVENNPAFRPDWKGIVEKLFDTSQSKIKPFLPGYIQSDFGERGASDYRLEAKLTIDQYTKILINFVLFYNKNYYMEDYMRDEKMIEENVKPTPLELWKWGIKNRAGKLRKEHPDTIKFYLLPRDTATVTSKGIKFKRMLYSCETAIKESWFIQARTNKSWKVDISYDPRNMDIVYLHVKDKSLFERCFLLEHQERYKNKVLEEIEQLLMIEQNTYKNENHSLLQEEINFYTKIEGIVDEAIKTSNQDKNNKITKTEKIKNIRENREVEKNLRREHEAFQIGVTEINNDENIISFASSEQKDEKTETSTIMELFKKQRRKKKE
ncbi:Mu transposase C-terminal domain-containing protein [Lysinibacillus fusiformis]|uniref:Mu transposase C-terminal domain-containing protein n=1 Tax=Lysinibacillus fusiformis TaxID=28031 RepID=UPI000E3364F3|nr:Mu transposase C-terminal domain-containing protein [Lysinibacillus fusiformis]AXQ50902.1 DNA-binding protein [Stenotrophomonas rhizophila]KAB0447227.1 DNA-binding protein [Lysinibacillus fusiformis]